MKRARPRTCFALLLNDFTLPWDMIWSDYTSTDFEIVVK